MFDIINSGIRIMTTFLNSKSLHFFNNICISYCGFGDFIKKFNCNNFGIFDITISYN